MIGTGGTGTGAQKTEPNRICSWNRTLHQLLFPRAVIYEILLLSIIIRCYTLVSMKIHAYAYYPLLSITISQKFSEKDKLYWVLMG